MNGFDLFDLVEMFFDWKEEKPRQTITDLTKMRNDCLIDRYYYYGKFTDKRYDAILNHLQQEFFINATYTIPELLNDNFELLDKLKASKPGKDYFKKKWPHLVW
jgi:hypothetical protein